MYRRIYESEPAIESVGKPSNLCRCIPKGEPAKTTFTYSTHSTKVFQFHHYYL